MKTKENIKFSGIGWKSKVLLKRATFYISISKLVAHGCCLAKGEGLSSYLAEDENRRKIIVIYLDGDQKEKRKKCIEANKFKLGEIKG